MPKRLLLDYLDSEEITLLEAYKRRNTLQPDVWFAAQQQALAASGAAVRRFVPIDDDDSEARNRRNLAAAEAAMDAELG